MAVIISRRSFYCLNFATAPFYSPSKGIRETSDLLLMLHIVRSDK
ncbi:hypothetical protein FM102_01510 [Corynebacterium glutamicum]|nr:hypothetical protein FM102_01510 [Corynebacterium glutamicum]